MTHLCCHYFNRVSILYQLCPATKSECSTVSCPKRRDPAWKVSYLVVGIYHSNRNHLTRRVTLPIPGSGLHYMLHTHTRPALLIYLSMFWFDVCWFNLPQVVIGSNENINKSLWRHLVAIWHETVYHVTEASIWWLWQSLDIIPANPGPVISASCFVPQLWLLRGYNEHHVSCQPLETWDTNRHLVNPTNTDYCLLHLNNGLKCPFLIQRI